MYGLLQDPEVTQAFMDISQNPANVAKYQNNPKIQRLMAKMTKKMGGGGAAGAGMGGDGPSPSPGGAEGSEPSSAAPEQPDID